MKKKAPPAADDLSLRQRAERQIGSVPDDSNEATVHELHVHQVELELQNEELRHVQAQLEVSRNRYFELYDLAPVGYVTLGVDGFITESNFAFARLVSKNRGRLLNQPFHSFVHPDDQAAFCRLCHGIKEAGKQEYAEMRLLGAERTPIWVQLQLSLSAQNEIRLTLADISKLRDAGDQLAKAIQLAESANHAKSEFLANVSHEIRTPLNGLMGVVQLLRQSHLDEDQRKLTEMALRSGSRLTELLSDILDISRIEAGRTILNEMPFRLADIFEAIAETFEPVAREKKIPLEFALAPEIPKVLTGDSLRIRQILFNLVGNAMKFTDRGRIKITATRAPSREPSLETVILAVEDSGIGIPPAMLGYVCQPFIQAPAGDNRPYKGVGLGLAISKRLAAVMQGTLEIRSLVGQGTTVTVTLPLHKSAAELPADPMRPAGPATPRQPLRILAAEDDAINLMTLELALEKMGHFVTCVSSGSEALSALAKETFDCVLMDLQMADIDGITATGVIRSGKAGKTDPALPVIAMTGFAMRGDRERFLAMGMTEYISKPIDLQDLSLLLDKVCAEKPAAASPAKIRGLPKEKHRGQ